MYFKDKIREKKNRGFLKHFKKKEETYFIDQKSEKIKIKIKKPLVKFQTNHDSWVRAYYANYDSEFMPLRWIQDRETGEYMYQYRFFPKLIPGKLPSHCKEIVFAEDQSNHRNLTGENVINPRNCRKQIF